MRTRRGLAIVVPLLAVLVLACGGGDESPSEPTPEPTATPAGSHPAEVALGAYLQSQRSQTYAGDCGSVVAGDVAGQYCSVLRGERENQRAYAVGPVGAEGTNWVFMGGQGDQWSVVLDKPITAESLAVPGVPWPLRTGVDVVVVVTGDPPCLNVRTGPSLSQGAVDCIANGTRIRLAAGPAEGDGITWWQVEGRAGWVSGDYLRYADATQ